MIWMALFLSRTAIEDVTLGHYYESEKINGVVLPRYSKKKNENKAVYSNGK